MAQEKYIKVTPQGEKEPRIILASLKRFYISQGAKVEDASDEEIAAAFPSEKEAQLRKQKADALFSSIQKENEELHTKVAASEEKIKELNSTIADKDAAIAELKEQLADALKKAAKEDKKKK